MKPPSLRIAQLEGQRDGAHMNSVELVKHVRHLLQLLDKGLPLLSDDRKAITKSIERVGRRRLPTAKAVENKVLRKVADWIDDNHEELSDESFPASVIAGRIRNGSWKNPARRGLG